MPVKQEKKKVFQPTKINNKVTKESYGINKVTTAPTRMLVMDDRLPSKQYIKGRIDARIDDTIYGDGWDGVTDKAPSVNAVYDKINSLGTVSDIWGQEDATSSSTDVRAKRTGNYGFGNGTSLAFDSITEKLYVDGNIKATGVLKANHVNLLVDSAKIDWGVDGDVRLEHIHNTGLKIDGDKKWIFNDENTYVHGPDTDEFTIASGNQNIQLKEDEIELNPNNGTVDINGSVDISSNLTVGGNLTVTGTATAIETTNTVLNDNIFILNNDATGSASVDAGIEVERGDDANTRLVWDESADKWSIQPTIAAETYYPIINTGDTGTVTNTMLAGSIANNKLTNDSVTVGSTEIDLGASSTTLAGLTAVTVAGTSGGSGTTALTITGGNSSATNPAVSITGHLTASTKSFNIPHPIHEDKRLIYGVLEGPEFGAYNRGTVELDVIPDRIAIDLPDYWWKLVGDDYTITLTPYGPYNVWIDEKLEDGFFVCTSASDHVKFDWIVTGGRKDAVIPEVEPQAP